MESGRPLHYHRNTIAPAQPSKKELARRAKLPLREPDSLVIPENTQRKICATLQCVWCSRVFDHYLVICPLCHQCQYCGLIGGWANGCHLCHNVLPPESRGFLELPVIRPG